MPTTLTLRFGSSGPAVVELQNALIGAKALPATATDGSANNDGKFGRFTQAAVKKFQEGHQLEADGIVGHVTRTALGLTPSAQVVVAQSATHIFTETQRHRLAEKLDDLIGTGLLDFVDDALFLWAVNKIDEVLAANLPQPIVNMMHDISQGLPNIETVKKKLALLLNQNVNIPFFSEETEQKIFEYIVGLLVEALGWGAHLEVKLGK